MRIGVDYYPEQWEESLWAEDIARMAACGVQVVRLAEFAWSKLEPQEGIYDFAWLDRVIALLEQHNMQIVLGTPTNCPPLWLYEAHPEAVQMGADGHRIAIGVRGHRCYRNTAFRQAAAAIIREMTTRYQHHPSIIAYQIDNELEANFCRCSDCQSGFRQFLQEKYGTLDALNTAYGNAMWSGSYAAWTQVTAPMGSYPKGWYNPSLMLDYHRFAAQDAAEFVQFQVDLIRSVLPAMPITTNTWFCENHVDFHRLFQKLDFVSYDNYPPTQLPTDPESLASHAFHLDFMRGIKQQNFWIMEQLSGALGSWSPMSRQPADGMISGYALQAFAHGADTVVHFRWRTAAAGAEMFWHGLLDHSNVPGRRFAEFRTLCATANTLQACQGAAFPAEVAILYDAQQEEALRIQPQSQGFDYLQQLKLWHDAGTRWGVNMDILGSEAALEGYRLVIAPALFLTDFALSERLYQYVEQGGILVLTTRSGVKDQYNRCVMDELPGEFRDLVGCYAAEYDPLGWTQMPVELEGERYMVSQLCDVLTCTSARPVCTYAEGIYQGLPAVTCNRYGPSYGMAYYVGTVGSRAFHHALMEYLLRASGVSFIPNLPLGMEVTKRRTEDATYYFLFNHTQTVQSFSFQGEIVELQPFEMRIIISKL